MLFLYALKLKSYLFKTDQASATESMETKNSLSSYYFYFILILYPLYLILLQPKWVLGGEMWAEMATNYFENAHSSNIWTLFFATDSGYIPLPQRILALIGRSLNLSTRVTPFFYTWTAIFFTSLMVGSFCLHPFRKLVKNDSLRLLAVIIVLICADFETRTFINFTYFAGFFITIITALALVENKNEVPFWCWISPILVISKPALLAVTPAMILVSIVSQSRFRRITFITIIFCIIQIGQMILSHTSGLFPSIVNYSLIEKGIASLLYFLGLLGGFTSGKIINPNKYFSTLIGILTLYKLLSTIKKNKNHANALLVVGLFNLLFNCILNTFVLSDTWNIKMENLNSVPLYRHVILGFSGVILSLTAYASNLHNQINSNVIDTSIKKQKWQSWSPFKLLFVWFIMTWLPYGLNISRDLNSPALQNSHWQLLSHQLEVSNDPICIPIDPLGWVYQRNCAILNPEINWFKKIEYREVPNIQEQRQIDIVLPNNITSSRILSIAILVKPIIINENRVSAKVIFKMKGGSNLQWNGIRQLDPKGSLLLLTAPSSSLLFQNIQSASLHFDQNVKIGYIADEPFSSPAILWMGQTL